ncbi:MAG TPA: hypothetical protein VEO01_35620 [Pseudonocardiaceae bacterium]|nr:hypothetical protein [Pseudonocardiaceae bacterium]
MGTSHDLGEDPPLGTTVSSHHEVVNIDRELCLVLLTLFVVRELQNYMFATAAAICCPTGTKARAC